MLFNSEMTEEDLEELQEIINEKCKEKLYTPKKNELTEANLQKLDEKTAPSISCDWGRKSVHSSNITKSEKTITQDYISKLESRLNEEQQHRHKLEAELKRLKTALEFLLNYKKH